MAESEKKVNDYPGDVVMLPLSGQRPKRITARQKVITEYVMPFTTPIGDIDEFGEEIEILTYAAEDDVVIMPISSPGGSLETCVYLCRRIRECAATIYAEIGLTCASAASAIALQADDWIIDDDSTMMIHACSYSPGYGTESAVRASVAYTERINREWVKRVYAGFLTDEEFLQILDHGKDLYFFADDLRDRLPKYQAYRLEQAEEQLAELQRLQEALESQ